MIDIPYFLKKRELVHCRIIDSVGPIVGIIWRGVMLGLLVISVGWNYCIRLV